MPAMGRNAWLCDQETNKAQLQPVITVLLVLDLLHEISLLISTMCNSLPNSKPFID